MGIAQIVYWAVVAFIALIVGNYLWDKIQGLLKNNKESKEKNNNIGFEVKEDVKTK